MNTEQQLDEQVESFPLPPAENPRAAVRQCLDAFEQMTDDAKAEGISARTARARAVLAFRLSMPVMESKATVQAYIACVAAGVQLGIFQGRDGSQLLYAAQVALSLIHGKKKAGRPKAARPAERKAA